MNLDQIDNLLARIKVHCPFFMKDYDKEDEKLLKKEWYKVLINYDSNDVNKSLDEFLQTNHGNQPTVYELVDGLTKKGNKIATFDDPVIRCPDCNLKLRSKEYRLHHNRHLSISYLSKMALKYSNINLDKHRLLKMDDSEFDKYYWSCCYSLISKINDPVEKHLLENAILTHEGKKPNLNFDEILKQTNINKR